MLHPGLIDARAAALVASLALHATVFAAATVPAVPPPSSPQEADLTIDVLVSPEASSTVVESAPAFPDGNAAPVRVSRAASIARHRSSDDGRLGPRSAPPQAAAVASAQAEDEPRFTIAIGAEAASLPVVASPGNAAAPADRAGSTPPDDAALSEDGVSSPARLASGAAPPYPESARRERVEGDVPLEIVVSPAGVVETARPLSHVGHGLDDAATAAVRQYRFRPAVKDGRAVRVRMRWVMQFRLW